MSQQMFILNQALDNIQSLFNILFILQGLFEDSSEASAANLSLTFIQKTQKSAVFILSIIWDSAHLWEDRQGINGGKIQFHELVKSVDAKSELLVIGLIFEEIIVIHQAHEWLEGLIIVGFLDVIIHILLKKEIEVFLNMLGWEALLWFFNSLDIA